MGGECSSKAEISGLIILFGKTEWKLSLVRSRRRRKDNIRIDIREMMWESVDWINLAQDGDQLRNLMNKVMSHRIS
jgi:hypothetical protein